MSQPNPFLLAADNPPALLPLLRSNPSLASGRDEHGYSLLHAAASYNHLDLLRALVQEFHVDVNLTDEDGETCLFVVESVQLAKCLVEDLGADPNIKNDEGLLAQEAIENDGSFPRIANYLREITGQEAGPSTRSMGEVIEGVHAPPPLPPNVRVDVGTMLDRTQDGEADAVDPEFKRRIDELASRGNFHSEEGQRELRELVADAIRGVNPEIQEKSVRRKID
jgi:hypothetical protein